jgi:hypothetical protein
MVMKNSTDTAKWRTPYISSKAATACSMKAENVKGMLVYFACMFSALIAYIAIKKPDRSRPKLKIDATELLWACPRSLNAFFSQLNHDEKPIDRPIAK